MKTFRNMLVPKVRALLKGGVVKLSCLVSCSSGRHIGRPTKVEPCKPTKQTLIVRIVVRPNFVLFRSCLNYRSPQRSSMLMNGPTFRGMAAGPMGVAMAQLKVPVLPVPIPPGEPIVAHSYHAKAPGLALLRRSVTG